MILLSSNKEMRNLEEHPEKPYLDDLQGDLNKIDTYHIKKEGIMIKKMMIEKILKSI